MITTGHKRFDRLIVDEQRVDGMTPCAIWQGTLSSYRYGIITIERKRWLAHRFAYRAVVGELDADLVIDHLCRVRHCVNPDHMEQVTSAENVRRGMSWSARNRRATHCIAGHEFTPANTYRNHDGRGCRECKRLRQIAARAALPRRPRPVRGAKVTHGKGGTYRGYGCRCEPCTAANSADVRAYRERRAHARKDGAA